MNSYSGKTQSVHRRKYPGHLQPTDREQNGTKKQVKTPQLDNNWITDFEEYFPDLDNFSSLDYSTLTDKIGQRNDLKHPR